MYNKNIYVAQGWSDLMFLKYFYNKNSLFKGIVHPQIIYSP